jgi:probable phosphoglycerate mutase
MEIVFVRHGESTANAEGIIQGRFDYELSERGKEQAFKTARALAEFKPFRVYTSPLVRARETAQIINRPHNAELVVLPDLVEYDLGGFEGLTFKEVLEKFPGLPEKLRQGVPFHHLAPGAETDEQVDKRVESALDEIIHSGLPRVILVSHLGVLERTIKTAAKNYSILDMPGPEAWPLKNCSLTRLSIEPQKCRVLMINDVTHLA